MASSNQIKNSNMGIPPRGVDVFVVRDGCGLGNPLHPPRELFAPIDDPAGETRCQNTGEDDRCHQHRNGDQPGGGSNLDRSKEELHDTIVCDRSTEGYRD